jgi:hypothetical protein
MDQCHMDVSVATSSKTKITTTAQSDSISLAVGNLFRQVLRSPNSPSLLLSGRFAAALIAPTFAISI